MRTLWCFSSDGHDAAQHDAGTCFSSGSSTLTTWKRRASAGSFSKYFLYSDQVVAAMVRSSPRARAGFSRLAASFWPAAPPAPIMVCASSMNRMIGVGDDFTSSIRPFEPIFEFALDARAGLQQRQIERAQRDVLQQRRHVAVGDAQREAFHHGGLADARLAGQDRVVLAAARQDVDHLADLEIAAQHRIDLALLGVLGEVDGELIEVGRLAARLRARRAQPARLAAAAAGSARSRANPR